MPIGKLLFIDGWNIIICQNEVSNIVDGNSNPIGAYLTTLNMLRIFIEKFRPTKVFFVLDASEAGERRRQIFPDYKGKKRIVGRESKVIIMEDDDNMVYGAEGAFQNQLILLRKFLELLPVTICAVPKCEADDVISYLALKNKDEFTSIIVSNDRDYLQLIEDNILVYRWSSKILYNEEVFRNEFKINPANYIYRKIILGDRSDALSGINGVGNKTFERLNGGLLGKKIDTPDEFVDYVKKMDMNECTKREKNALLKITSEDSINKIAQLYQLMKLDENCMSDEQKHILGLVIEEQMDKKFMKVSTMQMMRRTYFGRLYNGFDEEKWLHPFVFLQPNVKIKY